MKLSVLPVSYFKTIMDGQMSIGDWAREGAELGLDAIDISTILLTDRSPAALKQIKNEVASAGMVIGGASSYPDFTHPDSSQRETEKKQFLKDIQALAEVGTQIVRITAGQAHPGLDRNDGIHLAVDGITSMVSPAAELGIELVFENHGKPGVWDYYDFDYPTENFLSIAEQLRGSGVRIQFDTANPIAFGDEPLPILKRVYDEVRVVHIADTKTRGSLNPTVIGTGLVEFTGVFDYLKEKKYAHWLAIEEASFTGFEGIKTAVDFVRKNMSGDK